MLVTNCHHPADFFTTTSGPAVNSLMSLPLLRSYMMCTSRVCLLFGAVVFFFPGHAQLVPPSSVMTTPTDEHETLGLHKHLYSAIAAGVAGFPCSQWALHILFTSYTCMFVVIAGFIGSRLFLPLVLPACGCWVEWLVCLLQWPLCEKLCFLCWCFRDNPLWQCLRFACCYFFFLLQAEAVETFSYSWHAHTLLFYTTVWKFVVADFFLHWTPLETHSHLLQCTNNNSAGKSVRMCRPLWDGFDTWGLECFMGCDFIEWI